VSGATALSRLLKAARTPLWRVWAENSPFELKDVLKARGYRWNGDGNGRPRAWWRDVPDALLADEVAYLRREIYGYEADILSIEITAYDRHSDRA
jgi:DNA polymerase-3 subunit epsilon